ncbi:DMT family transporter [Actinoalloteichus hymeniacidonis]|uniref:Permease, DMT superfamily n=1 Tax=Actinoalloteichus hymeniacidonis TaxID=340345 RepID=A0AAC9MZY7_9PSEU|nr:EamA family transporter [Actinoalloteichus hymeniacidonis]AOS65938.1 putative permease, DMT superfamily [Actinoalloteichus hymeniacidonis]
MNGAAGTTADRTWLVACAAALWGTDGLLRQPLAEALPAGSVVFWEHLIIVLVMLPFLPSALRALAACGWRERLAVLVIGVGSSAVATALFTASFAVGDAVTPLVLQKLQPLFAILAAYWLLGERVRRTYWLFAVPALIGAWLLSFANPLDVQVTAVQSALLALGAAVLWAAGTVLGRLVSSSIPARDLTVLRFGIGLPAATVVLLVQGDPIAVGWDNALGLGLLAIVPGLLALSIYYVGLRSTPASRATLAELAFPATAALIGVGLLGVDLSATQWIGFLVVVAAITGLGWHEKVRPKPVVSTAS